jgi:hypothetical protein
VPVTSQENEWTCICALEISILPLSLWHSFQLLLWLVFDCWHFVFVFHSHSYKAVNRRRTDNTMTKIKPQKDKQWYAKHYTENKIFWATRTPLQTRRQHRCSGTVGMSWSRRITIVANPMISHDMIYMLPRLLNYIKII